MNTEKTVYRCNVCYIKKGVLLNSCGCFYCMECHKDSKSYINIETMTCYSCGKNIDYKKTIDITNKESVKKVEFIYDEPEITLKKIIEVIKFQKLHKAKYIEFLEKKMEELTKENLSLKESVMNGRVEYLNNLNSSNKPINNQSLSKINNNQFLDLKQIKKIEPKKLEKNLSKVPKNLPNNEYVKIDNLNAKTAEIMKQSPGMNNNFQNFNPGNSNQRALINVNINNSNKINKEDLSNYEKNLFTKKNNLNNNLNIQQNQNFANQNINPYYQHQKRNFNKMNNYYNDINNNNAGEHFQTPMPNNNYEFNHNTKKMKYN